MAGIPLPVGADYWQDCSFVRCADSGRLVVCYVAATLGTDASGNENTGPLEVVVYDDADPPQPGTPQVIEAGLCTAAKLLSRPDGTLDLFYGYDCVSLLHRVSRDGGATWSAPSTVYSSAGPVCAVDVGAPLGTPPYTSVQNDSLCAVFAPTVGLIYLWYRAEFVGAHPFWRVTGSLDSDGETWNWATPVSDNTPAANSQVKMPQATRDGALLLHTRAVWIYPQGDGGHTLRTVPPGASWSVLGYTWLDERTGLWVNMARPATVGPHLTHTFQVNRGHLDTDLLVKGGTNPTTPKQRPGWGASPTDRGQNVGQIGVRRDGCWEFLFAQPSGELDFKRCRSVPLNESGSTSGMVWS